MNTMFKKWVCIGTETGKTMQQAYLLLKVLGFKLDFFLTFPCVFVMLCFL